MSDKKLCFLITLLTVKILVIYTNHFGITAYVKRFIAKLGSRICKNMTAHSGTLTVAEIEVAKTLWIKQLICHDSKFKQIQFSLGLYKDDCGILRCSDKIRNPLLPYSTNCPVLLRKKHYFTRLVILDCYEKVFHNKINETLTQLRSGYWVVKGRHAVKEGVGKCIICKNFERKCYSTPSTPPLPSFRES